MRVVAYKKLAKIVKSLSIIEFLKEENWTMLPKRKENENIAIGSLSKYSHFHRRKEGNIFHEVAIVQII